MSTGMEISDCAGGGDNTGTSQGGFEGEDEEHWEVARERAGFAVLTK